MLLGHLFPEYELLWTVRSRGTFYRNYSADVMDIDEDELTIDIARDGQIDASERAEFDRIAPLLQDVCRGALAVMYGGR